MYALVGTVLWMLAFALGALPHNKVLLLLLLVASCFAAFVAATRGMEKIAGPAHGDSATRLMTQRIGVLALLGIVGGGLASFISPMASELVHDVAMGKRFFAAWLGTMLFISVGMAGQVRRSAVA